MAVLQELYLYPIKSTHAVSVQEAAVEARGLAHDRRWMLVDADGRFLSQRELPALVRVQAYVVPAGLRITAPGTAPLEVARPAAEAPRLAVRIWKNTVEAALAEAPAHAWFSRVLGRPCRLVFMDEAARRPVDPTYAVGDDYVSFADGYPLLLTTQASLEALNARLATPVPMNRFRPNVVISGVGAFAEDGWQRIRIGAVTFHVVKPCARCAITTTDQQTGAVGVEPLRTLATFRRRDGKVYFGQNLIPQDRGVIRAGDAVTVLASAERSQPLLRANF